MESDQRARFLRVVMQSDDLPLQRAACAQLMAMPREERIRVLAALVAETRPDVFVAEDFLGLESAAALTPEQLAVFRKRMQGAPAPPAPCGPTDATWRRAYLRSLAFDVWVCIAWPP